jgi:hypothetical protein
MQSIHVFFKCNHKVNKKQNILKIIHIINKNNTLKEQNKKNIVNKNNNEVIICFYKV